MPLYSKKSRASFWPLFPYAVSALSSKQTFESLLQKIVADFKIYEELEAEFCIPRSSS